MTGVEVDHISLLASDMESGHQIYQYLIHLIDSYGAWVYGILFTIIFLETGLIIMPFLPGDSLLFVSGTIWAQTDLNVHHLCIILIAAAILGDNFNYWLGHYLGPKMFKNDNARFFKKSSIDYTHAFLHRHGGKTLVVARFLPIARTYAPFVAGIGKMEYPRFILFSCIGACLWVTSLVYAGYIFGNIPFVKDNLPYLMLAIVVGASTILLLNYLRGPVMAFLAARNGKGKAPTSSP